MKKIVSKDLDFDIQLEEILSLDRGVPVDINETVKNIISDVKENGDESLIKLTNKLDNNKLSLDNILVSQDEIEFASKNISKFLMFFPYFILLICANLQHAFSDPSELSILMKESFVDYDSKLLKWGF